MSVPVSNDLIFRSGRAEKGKELVELAKSLGALAAQVVYAGKQHGFDFADHDPVTADAILRLRVVQFFKDRLLTA
jgi:carboxymethylenebutenolidase